MRIWGFKEYIDLKTGNAGHKSFRLIIAGILILIYILLIPAMLFVMLYLGYELKAGTAEVIGAGVVFIAALFFVWQLIACVFMSRFRVYIKDDIGLFRAILGSSNTLKLKNPYLVDGQLHMIETLFNRARESGGELDITNNRHVPIMKIDAVKNIRKRWYSYTVNCTVLRKGKLRSKTLRIRGFEDIDALIREFEFIMQDKGLDKTQTQTI